MLTISINDIASGQIVVGCFHRVRYSSKSHLGSTKRFRTNSQIRDTVLCRSVTKNLTDYRFNSAGWGLDDMKAEIHSFPTMYIIGGGKWGRNGSKLRFSQKKWPKNSFFEGHKSGSTDFGGV